MTSTFDTRIERKLGHNICSIIQLVFGIDYFIYMKSILEGGPVSIRLCRIPTLEEVFINIFDHRRIMIIVKECYIEISLSLTH